MNNENNESTENTEFANFSEELEQQETVTTAEVETTSTDEKSTPTADTANTPTTSTVRTEFQKCQARLKKRVTTGICEEVPELSEIIRGKKGKTMKIKDIAIFTDHDRECLTDDGLKELAEICSKTNEINLKAPITLNQIAKVGKQIMKSGKMHTPITTVSISEDGSVQCNSGRHRLCLFALLYGPEAKVNVYHEEDVPLCEAIDSVPYANAGRPTRGMEKAEHIAMIETNGKLDLTPEQMYLKFATNASRVKDYIVHLLGNKELNIAFNIGTPKQGGICKEGAFKNYCYIASGWDKSLNHEEFSTRVFSAIEFLNAYQKAAKQQDNYSESQFLASKPLGAVAMYFNNLNNKEVDIVNVLTEDDETIAECVASVVSNLITEASQGKIATQQSNDLYNMIIEIAPTDFD